MESALIQLQEVNRKLERDIARRKDVVALLEAPLRRRVTFALIVALALTLLIGVFAWRGGRQIESDGSWIAQTYAAMDGIQIGSRNFVNAEISARESSLTGKSELLAEYENARNIIPHGFYASGDDVLEIGRPIAAIDGGTWEMHAEEIRLLAQRSETARRQWRSTRWLIVLGIFSVGVLLALSWIAV